MPDTTTAGPKAQFLDVFRREQETTLKATKAFPADKGSFKPHDRSLTAIDLAWITVQARELTITALEGRWTMPPQFPPAPKSYVDVVAAVERSAGEFEAVLEKTPEEMLFTTIPFFTGPKQMGEVRIIDLLWFTLMDSIHHRGQLSVYIRMAGGKVPSIYGPSADEPWM